MDESIIMGALVQADGLVKRAADILGVPRSSLQKALETWGIHLGKEAARLRLECGHGAGHPLVNAVPPDVFLEAWEVAGRMVATCARALQIDRTTVVLLANRYGVPEAPPPRGKSRKA